ncbi:hypothetical protein G7B40_037110 [Aetokthonos hydrillicola Thurmond2011]|jgi:hypothetical protein|uniref:Uncharacterized protein n=1 Tax=Aetokthonos hydrillicola Thurmond2011 TaxID=2712845 RepID=A0AAP5IGH1_9CYAN|nr:hypothetical protein [Aetokthonos hydrillicola]MBO3457255.1 hypothetical protein [Aetokthonos hydrillicola CCALA 1050]MBW4586596.1 hypothetical protein [Aetokthonos hydrillicola CCALA 1050]MDR9900129.1 hypothetical protein [Aetokthonos hydrillicola Thurmond2011]
MRESACKRLSSGTRKGNRSLRTTLVQAEHLAAWAGLQALTVSTAGNISTESVKAYIAQQRD